MPSAFIKELTEAVGFPRVSIFFPTFKTGPEVQQNAMRLKNALKNVAADLEGHLDPREIDNLLADARERLDDATFWQHQERGLAVLIKPGMTSWRPLRREVDEFHVISARFHIRPLIPTYRDRGNVHVLAATRGQVQVFHASHHDIEPVEVD